MSAMEEIFEAVRAAASRTSWSRGVELARGDAVSVASESEGEVELRVATRGGLRVPTVTLQLAGAFWDCDCSSTEEACEHAAAAVIAWRRARAEGRALRAAEQAAGRIGYRLARAESGLALTRVVVLGGTETPLAASLAAIASGRVAGPSFSAGDADRAIEALLGPPSRAAVPRGLLPRLLELLERCDDVRFEGEPVRTSGEPVLPEARLTDHPSGFLLALQWWPRGSDRVAEGVLRVDGVLRPLGRAELTGRERDEYGRGRVFRADEVAVLVGDVLPSLRARITVVVETSRLPRTEKAPPRLDIAARRSGDRLVVRADVVYGRPPVARVEDDRLVVLGGTVPIRDEAAERALARRLASELELAPGREATFADAAALEMAARLARFDGGVGGAALRDFREAPPLVPRFSLAAGGSDFALEFPLADAREARGPAVEAVLRAFEEGRERVMLPDGGLAPLPRDWLARFGPLLRDLLEARAAAAGALPRCALPDLARLCAALDLPPPPDYARLRAAAEDFDGIPPAALPADLAADLRSYQRRGVDWLCFLRGAGFGALLADDMGLGKTLQALCAIEGRALVVCPTSVLRNWQAEALRFRPSLHSALYHGAGRSLARDADLVITSYGVLRQDAELLAREPFDTLVLDESHAIKNPDSQVAQAAFALRARFRLALTGTPLENRLEELWSQMHFANPGLLGGLASFRERYARKVADGDAAAEARLRERVRPFLLRRRKSEVAPELPPRTEALLLCELDPEERRLYEALRAATRREVVARLDAGASVFSALEALLRLRQAACHRALVPGQTAESSSKLDLLLEELEEIAAEGHRALVFSQWTSLLDLVEPHLTRRGLDFVRLDGSTRDRAGVVARFQGDAGPPVFLLSLKAGGTGLNLTAADHVYLLDPWWNPAAEDQAADRAHRIGQTKSVLVKRLVAEGTVEERVLALEARKRALADAALAGGGAATPITREDLLQLLE
jgi:superfamily II DNA or RNA helicase